MGDDSKHAAWIERNPLRRWRKANGCTIMRAAVLLAVSITTIQSWEQGAATPTTANMARLADVLEVEDLEARWNRWANNRPAEAVA